MIYDNPYLEHTFYEGEYLTKWDYEILKKAIMKAELIDHIVPLFSDGDTPGTEGS